MGKADTASYAAAMAYNFLFALFPLLLFLTALLGLIHLPHVSQFFRGPAGVLIAPNIRQLILRTIHEAERHRSPTLLSLGVLGFLWGMSGALRQLADALNHAYGYHRLKRPMWKTVIRTILLGLFLGVLLTSAEALVGLGGDLIRLLALHWFGHSPNRFLVQGIRWIVLLALMWVILVIAYNWLPDHIPRFQWFSAGILLAIVAWIAISLGFSFYAAHFNRYNMTYGGLGGVVLLMLYLYILSFALLFGADLDMVLSKNGSRR